MNSSVAILWDESFTWGLMSLRSLMAEGLSFKLISAEDVREGKLDSYSTVFVPGGWASKKIIALGEKGAENMRQFVRDGGMYIGICGGAGLATGDGLSLIEVSRKSLKERVPSLSGKVRLGLDGSVLWDGISEPYFNVWWPSQFVPKGDNIIARATFDSATDAAFSSDINVGDVAEGGWREIEKRYNLNLNPLKMAGDPVVIEGQYGKGKVIASLVHFDTPSDANGAKVLHNIWAMAGADTTVKPRELPLNIESAAFKLVKDLFEFGRRNFLWFRRELLIQWRRGIRGLEYFNLYDMTAMADADVDSDIELMEMLTEFTVKAKELLMLERLALGRGEVITFSKGAGSEMDGLREHLFSKSKSHGGLFKDILDRLDYHVYTRLKRELL